MTELEKRLDLLGDVYFYRWKKLCHIWGCNLNAHLDPSQVYFPLQAVSVLHEGTSPEAGEEPSLPASWWVGAILLCPALVGEQRCAEEVAHVHVSVGSDAATDQQKVEVNAMGGLVLSPKYSV